MRNTCTSRVGIPCRFAARDPSTLGDPSTVVVISLRVSVVNHLLHSPASSITTLHDIICTAPPGREGMTRLYGRQ